MTTTQIRLTLQALRGVARKDAGIHPVEALRAQAPAMIDGSVDENQEHHQRTLPRRAKARQAIGSLDGRDELRISAICRALGVVKKWVLS